MFYPSLYPRSVYAYLQIIKQCCWIILINYWGFILCKALCYERGTTTFICGLQINQGTRRLSAWNTTASKWWNGVSNPDSLRRVCVSLPLCRRAVCEYCREYLMSSNCGTFRESVKVSFPEKYSALPWIDVSHLYESGHLDAYHILSWKTQTRPTLVADVGGI